MAQNGGDKEDKFDDFTAEGEALGYISLEQARVLAMQHARDNRDFYGSAYSKINLVWEVISQDEGEDYYDIRLSFRPAGRFRGEPGVEQFIIDKTGSIEIRQILDEPTGLGQPRRRRPRWLLPATVGLVVVVGVVGLLIVFAVIDSGLFDGNGVDGSPQALVAAATSTPSPTLVPTSVSTSTPVPAQPDATEQPVSPNSISVARLRQLLFERIEEIAPRFPKSEAEELVSAVLRDAQTSGKTLFTPDEVRDFVTLAVTKARSAAPQPPGDVSGQRFNFLLACIDLTLKPCGLLQDFATAVFDRTNGRVEMQVASFSELGIAGPDVLKLIADGKPQLAEVFTGLVAGELPILDLTGLLGLFPDTDAQLKVIDVIREELHSRIEERSNGVVILENYYSELVVFSKKPVQSPGDFKD